MFDHERKERSDDDLLIGVQQKLMGDCAQNKIVRRFRDSNAGEHSVRNCRRITGIAARLSRS